MAWVTIDLNTNRVIYVAGGANPFGVPPGKLEINTGSGGGGQIGWIYDPQDNSVKAPPSFVAPVRCATTQAQTLITDFQIGDVIDGVTLAAGDRVLIKDQADAKQNCICLIYPSGNIPPIDTATDASSPQEMLGLTVRVLEGTVNAGSLWTCTTSPIPGPALGTDDLTFKRIDPRGVFPQGADGTSLTADSSTVTDVAWVTPLNVQTFASSGTWTKPTSPRYTRAAVMLVGPGGGGASGRRAAAGGIRNGGGGGGGGAIVLMDIALSTLGATETVTIGTGGAGGAAQTTNDTNGNAGVAGSGFSLFGSVISAGTGAGGTAGDATGAAGADAFPGLGQQSGGFGAGFAASGGTGIAGRGTNTGQTVTFVITTISLGAAGGGSAGGITAANSGGAGGAGGNNAAYSASGVAGGTGGGAGSGQTAGTAGSAAPTGSTFGGKGGGGGASGASGAGTAGGAGGAPGGGGGGGGAAVNGVNSGVGGAGANGYCAVVCY